MHIKLFIKPIHVIFEAYWRVRDTSNIILYVTYVYVFTMSAPQPSQASLASMCINAVNVCNAEMSVLFSERWAGFI